MCTCPWMPHQHREDPGGSTQHRLPQGALSFPAATHKRSRSFGDLRWIIWGGLNSAISFQTSVVERDLPALTGAHPQAEEDDVDHCSQRGAGALAQSCGTDPDSVHWHCRKALRVWYSQDTPKRGRGARQNDRYPSKKRRIHG